MVVIGELRKRMRAVREFSDIRRRLANLVRTDERLNSLFPPVWLSEDNLHVLTAAGNSGPTTSLEAELSNVRAALATRIESRAIELPQFGDALRYTQRQSGKMIRARLVLLFGQALGSGQSSLLAQAGELLHAASLLHDDVVDASDTRRGMDSHRKIFGDRTAVLTGDNLISILVDVLSEIGSLAVTTEIASAIEALVIGELLQLRGVDSNEFADEIQGLIFSYTRKSYFKTGSLFAALLKCVGTLSSANRALPCASFGYYFGLAFQLTDDILDFEGTQDVAGKPAGGSDLRNGTATLPIFLACRDAKNLHASERTELLEMVHRRFSRPADCDRSLHLLRKSDGLAMAKETVHEYLGKCREILRGLVIADSPHFGAIDTLLAECEFRQK